MTYLTLPLHALELARSYIMTRETAHNSGPHIDRWLRWVELSPGDPWCAAFVHGMFREAVEAMADVGVLALNPCPAVGGVHALWRRSRQSAHIEEPQPGALALADHGEGKGHVWFVDEVLPDGFCSTIEGNTNGPGMREGDRVLNRTRHVAEATLGYLYFDSPALT